MPTKSVPLPSPWTACLSPPQLWAGQGEAGSPAFSRTDLELEEATQSAPGRLQRHPCLPSSMPEEADAETAQSIAPGRPCAGACGEVLRRRQPRLLPDFARAPLAGASAGEAADASAPKAAMAPAKAKTAERISKASHRPRSSARAQPSSRSPWFLWRSSTSFLGREPDEDDAHGAGRGRFRVRPQKMSPSAGSAEGRRRESEAGEGRSRLGAYPAKGLTPATASAGWMAVPPWSMSSRR